MFGPLMHVVKCLQAESVIYDHCTSTIEKKNRSMSTAVIYRAICTCPGRAGPVFRLDQTWPRHRRDDCTDLTPQKCLSVWLHEMDDVWVSAHLAKCVAYCGGSEVSNFYVFFLQFWYSLLLPMEGRSEWLVAYPYSLLTGRRSPIQD